MKGHLAASSSRISIFIIILLALTGCDNYSLKKYINQKWPPVSLEQQRAEAITNFSENLGLVTYPTLGFSLNLNSISSLLLNEELQKDGIVDINLSSDHQLLEVFVKFDVNAADISDETIIDNLQPKIKGDITFYAGVTNSFNQEDNNIDFRILPYLHHVNVESIQIKEKYEVGKNGELLFAILNDYSDNISGELSRLKIMEFNIPASYTKPVMLSDALKNQKVGEGVKVNFTDKPINPPFKLTNIITLINNNKISGMIELYDESLYELESPIVEPVAEKADYPALVSRYNDIESKVFSGINQEHSGWFGVRKDLISHLLSNSLNQAQLCVSVDASTRNQSKQKIDLPDGSGINCTPTRDCRQTRNCQYDPNVDRRNCRACILRNPFGGCSIRGNDPLCEIAKATQNELYKADAAAKKLNCERIKETKRLACEAEKATEKGLCETKKAALDLIGNTGNFANVESDIKMNGNANLCIENTTIDANFSSINSSIRASGKVRVNVGFKFVPLEIVGLLTCPFPWTEDYGATATVLEQSIPFNANISLSTDNGKAIYSYAVSPLSIEAELSPTPAELIIKVLESTNMNMACPVTGVARTVTVPLRPFIPLFPETHTFKSKEVVDSGEIELPELSVSGRKLIQEFTITEEVIFYSLKE